MITALLLVNNAGLVVFEKIWVPIDVKEDGLGRLGSVFRTIREQSFQSTGCVPSYIEFENVAASFVFHENTKLLCILLHDMEDGQELGHLIANEITRAFVAEYQDKDFTRIIQKDVFQSFHHSLTTAILGVNKRIIDNLKKTRGLKGALYRYGDDNEDVLCNLENIDDIGIVANLSELLESASNLVQTRGEGVEWISLTLSISIVFIHHCYGDNFLVTICRNNVSKHKYINAIEDSVQLLVQVSEIIWQLRGAA